MDGVKGVNIDFAGRLATCTVSGKFDEKKAMAALDAEDYGPSSITVK